MTSFKALFLVALVLCSVHQSTAYYGVDVSAYTDVFSCLVDEGYSFAIIRIYRSTGEPDSNAVPNIDNAWDGGMSYVDGYIFPCYSCGDPAGQMKDAIDNLEDAGVTVRRKHQTNEAQNLSATIGMVWLDIEGTEYWSSSTSSNVEFIQEMVDEAEDLDLSLGFYTSYSQWDPITGDTTKFKSYDLWYAHYDDKASFSDFSAFGGWTEPAIKQYEGDVTVCGADVDKDYYP